MGDRRVELQAEVDRPREEVFRLVSTPEGLRRWLDEATLDASPGAAASLTLLGAVAVGKVLAVDPPQHFSLSWDWADHPLGIPTVVAFDLIDHGRRTHLTLRHVGFRTDAQRAIHDALWRHWFPRLVEAARGAAID